MSKPGVMFYFDIRPCLKRLSTEEKGLLFEAILDYAEHGMEPDFDGVVGVAWDFIKPGTDGLPTFSRVYTRIDVFLCYYSLLNIINKEMSNTSNRYGFHLWRATFFVLMILLPVALMGINQ